MDSRMSAGIGAAGFLWGAALLFGTFTAGFVVGAVTVIVWAII